MKIVIPKIKAKMVLVLIFGYIVLLIATICNEASFLLMMVLMVWFYFFILSVSDIKNNIALFCFLISFFVFLIGREVCFNYFSVKVYYKYLVEENSFAFICLLLGMVGVGLGNFISSSDKSNVKMNIEPRTSYYPDYVQKIVMCAFFLSYLFSVIATFIQIFLVKQIGYLASYTDEALILGVPPVVSYISALTPTFFCLFLATYPNKKRAIVPIFLYEIYAILTVFTGKRYPFIAISMIILIYLVIRNKNEKGWITRRMVYAIIISIPLLLVFLSAYDSIRIGERVSYVSITDTIINFFDEQGGSINVIKRVKYHEEELKDLSFCSFENLRSVLTENLIVREITGAKVLSGNSVERAMNGNSLMHRLSYYTYGSAYLLGRGVGSCYIAELFHDFGYIGIFIGSVFLGRILRLVSYIDFSHFLRDGILLAIMYYVLLAPRGNFDGFIGGVFSIYSIVGIIFLYILVKYAGKKYTV